MTYAKVITALKHYELESSINEWLKSNDDVEIIDIKYQTTQHPSYMTTLLFSTLIIYKRYPKKKR